MADGFAFTMRNTVNFERAIAELFPTTAVDVTRGVDVTTDGQRFVFIRNAPNAPRETPAITVVQNWFHQFKNRQAAK